jgi:hypothetical protein
MYMYIESIIMGKPPVSNAIFFRNFEKKNRGKKVLELSEGWTGENGTSRVFPSFILLRAKKYFADPHVSGNSKIFLPQSWKNSTSPLFSSPMSTYLFCVFFRTQIIMVKLFDH